jgi:hypothetical protein
VHSNGSHTPSLLGGKSPVHVTEVIHFVSDRSFVNLSNINEEAPLLQSKLSSAFEYVNYKCHGLQVSKKINHFFSLSYKIKVIQSERIRKAVHAASTGDDKNIENFNSKA